VAESPVRKGEGEWRVIFVGVQAACVRGSETLARANPKGGSARGIAIFVTSNSTRVQNVVPSPPGPNTAIYRYLGRGDEAISPLLARISAIKLGLIFGS
jgi:hypothetical protein